MTKRITLTKDSNKIKLPRSWIKELNLKEGDEMLFVILSKGRNNMNFGKPEPANILLGKKDHVKARAKEYIETPHRLEKVTKNIMFKL